MTIYLYVSIFAFQTRNYFFQEAFCVQMHISGVYAIPGSFVRPFILIVFGGTIEL